MCMQEKRAYNAYKLQIEQSVTPDNRSPSLVLVSLLTQKN